LEGFEEGREGDLESGGREIGIFFIGLFIFRGVILALWRGMECVGGEEVFGEEDGTWYA